jgi:mRNA interferase RelE/StbE
MRVTLSPAADRDVDRLSPQLAERVFAALRALREDPRPSGCRLLRDQASRTWRVRVGDWSVLYDIDDAAAVVTVLPVLHRREAYR